MKTVEVRVGVDFISFSKGRKLRLVQFLNLWTVMMDYSIVYSFYWNLHHHVWAASFTLYAMLLLERIRIKKFYLYVMKETKVNK